MSRQLPHSTPTIALVYNAKAEAAPESRSSAGPDPLRLPQATTHEPPGRDAALSPLPPVAPPAPVNDLYAEWDTMDTINAVRAALDERCTVVMIEADELAYEALRTARPDFVFNIAEGLHGVSREAQIPAILEMLRIPYLGSDPLTLATCLDKARTKEILGFHGIRTPSFAVVRTLADFEDARVRFPVLVKPLHEGSSKGIMNSSLAKNAAELEAEVRRILEVYHQPALLEEYLPGREFTVAILGNGEAARTLPIVEIRFDALPAGMNPIYSYEAKWVWDTADRPLEIFECPARLAPALREEMESLCLSAYRVLHCRDWTRIDVRLDGAGRPHILELNPLPGILPRPEDNSCFPKAARAAGMTYNQLINAVLDAAMARCGLPLPSRRPVPVPA